MKNLPEFKTLINRYETITIEDIEERFKKYAHPQERLTGFGSKRTCVLCKAVDGKCELCVYGGSHFNTTPNCIEDETYNLIEDAKWPNELLEAYRARATYMRKLLKEKGIEL